jgi:Xaa-Pro aminopeptidase
VYGTHPVSSTASVCSADSVDVSCARGQVREKGASAMLVTALDEIAWLFNIRGGDVDYNPVVIAYSRE